MGFHLHRIRLWWIQSQMLHHERAARAASIEARNHGLRAYSLNVRYAILSQKARRPASRPAIL